MTRLVLNATAFGLDRPKIVLNLNEFAKIQKKGLFSNK